MAVTLSVTIQQVSQNIANNTSQVKFTVKATATGGSYNNYNSGSYAPSGTIKYGGQLSGSNSYTHSFAKNSTTTIYTVTKTVTHKADGTAKVTASANLVTHVSAGTITASASKTLTTIPRASSPSVSGSTQLGSAITINTNRKSSGFTHTLTWSWAGKSGTIATGVGASTKWTPAIATFAPYLTNATSGKCTITCTTYSGSTNVGSKTCSFTLSIPSSVVPSISAATISDAKGYLTTYGAYVQNMSSVKATATAAGIYGSTIKTYKAEMDGLTASGTSNALTLGAPPNTGSRSVKVTVTDSRGRTATKTVAITVVAYSTPVISAEAFRYNSSTGKEDDEATTIRVHAKGSVTNVNSKGKNTGTVKIEWKLSTSSTWTSASNAARGQSFDFNLDLTGKANTSRFDVRVTVTDSLGSVTQLELHVGTAQPVMDFRVGGEGVAVLGIADRDGFRVGARTSFGGNLGLEDSSGTTHDFIQAQGNGRPTLINHIGLANGIYLQAALKSGAFANILSMNSSDEVELNWTSKGLKGRVWKQLWSGSLTNGGSVTNSEFQYYSMLALSVAGSDSTIIAIRDVDNSTADGGTVYRGCSLYPYVASDGSTNAFYFYGCDLDLTSNLTKLTVARAWGCSWYVGRSGSNMTYANSAACTFSLIYGII